MPFRFSLPVNEAHLVDILDGEDTFGNIEPGHVLREGVVLDQHSHQISARQELHDQVQVLGILERIIQLHNPRRFRLCQYISFRFDVSKLYIMSNVYIQFRVWERDNEGRKLCISRLR